MENKKSSGILKGILLLFGLGLIFLLLMVVVSALYFTDSFSLESIGKEKVGLVKITDLIVDSEDTIRQIREHKKDDSIKGILVRIDSPGGGVGASQEIYSELLKASKVKPVVASMGAVAASGGLYIAVAANKIVASPGTVTGSIGVIMELLNITELMGKAGVQEVVLKSGKYKDSGIWSREFTDDDRKVLMAVVDDMYDQFVQAVAEGRNMKVEEVLPLADGRVFSGRMAKELGLVDELGDYYDSVEILGKMAGIDGEPEVVEKLDKEDFFRRMFEERIVTLLPLPVRTVKSKLFGGPQYLWAY